jgi:hypothetical protein
MTEEYGHISDAFDMLPEEELLMNHEEMLEEAANREAERKALDALDRHYEENGSAFGQLAYIEQLERDNE